MWFEQQKFIKPSEALEALRDHLGLHQRMPEIDRVHLPPLLAVDPEERAVRICAHDSANECSYAIWWPAPDGPVSLGADDDLNVNEEIRTQCELFLCAAYN